MKLSNRFLDLVQVSCDAKALDLNELYVSNGFIENDSILGFIKELPKEEQGALLDEGNPTIEAYARCLKASMLKGYQNEKLIHLANRGGLCPNAKSLLNVLAFISREYEELGKLLDGYDFRDILAEAVALSIDELEHGVAFANLGQERCAFYAQNNHYAINKAVFACQLFLANHSTTYEELSDELVQLVWDIKDLNKNDVSLIDTIEKAFIHPDKNCLEPVKQNEEQDLDPLFELSKLFKPKMSYYMNWFWHEKGADFFASSTRKDFLDSLKKYREKLERFV